MNAALAADGFSVSVLPAPPARTEHSPWLGVSQEDDAAETISAISFDRPDWLIVDQYGLDRAWELQLRGHADRILLIDDLANREHEGDVLLDQNYFDQPESRYADRVPAGCRMLLGPRYALLHPDYTSARSQLLPRAENVGKMLLFVGGTDNTDVTGRLLGILTSPEFSQMEVDVVVGSAYPYKESLRAKADLRHSTRLHEAIPTLTGIMAEADLAIGAGGTTVWERLCLGLPSLVVSLAPNQVPVCEALAAAGLIEYAGPIETLTDRDITSILIKLIDGRTRRAEQSTAGLRLVDGRGAQRVAEILMPTPMEDLATRTANAGDMLTYLEWANDPDVRESAISSDPISLPSHVEWFEKRLASSKSRMFVLEADGLPVGQVRFDTREDGTWIDYSLDRLVRGRGWARHMLVASLNALNNEFLPLRALVKNSNQASLAVFRSLRFEEMPSDDEATTVFMRDHPGNLLQ